MSLYTRDRRKDDTLSGFGPNVDGNTGPFKQEKEESAMLPDSRCLVPIFQHRRRVGVLGLLMIVCFAISGCGSQPSTRAGELLASESIGPEGGTIAAPQGPVVTVPEGALAQTTTVSISAVATSQLTALPSSINPESTAFRVEVAGAEPQKPLEVTLSIPSTEELVRINSFPCVLSHDASSNSWSIPVQFATEDGLVVVESSRLGEFVVSSISNAASGVSNQRQISQAEVPFVFGQDNFRIFNNCSGLVRYCPGGACWGFTHFAAWHYENYRCEHLYHKYPMNVQIDIVEEAMDAQLSLAAIPQQFLLSVQNTIGWPLVQDMLTIGTIKTHLELHNTPAIISLFTLDGLLSLPGTAIETIVEALGGGNIEFPTVASHTAIVYSCDNGLMKMYDPNRDGERIIRYSPDDGILPYEYEGSGVVFQNVLYQKLVASEQMKQIHDSYQHLATIPEGACDDGQSGSEEGGECDPNVETLYNLSLLAIPELESRGCTCIGEEYIFISCEEVEQLLRQATDQCCSDGVDVSCCDFNSFILGQISSQVDETGGIIVSLFCPGVWGCN